MCSSVPTTQGSICHYFLSPAKDCVSVPGMEDVSPEELRSVVVRYCETSVSILRFQAGGLCCQVQWDHRPVHTQGEDIDQ